MAERTDPVAQAGAVEQPDGLPNDRTRGNTAIVEGFFATMWFGWGQAQPPPWLGSVLTAGTVVAVLVAACGLVVAVRARAQLSPLHERSVLRRYLIIFYGELAVLVVGAFVLAAADLTDWTPVWVAAGVGIHFIPLASVFRDPRMIAIGVLITMVALVALVVGLVSAVAPSAVTGAGVGACLLAGGAVALVLPVRGHRGGR